MTSPVTRGNSATIWLTMACSGADGAAGGPGRAGVWPQRCATLPRIAARRIVGATSAERLGRFIRDTISLPLKRNGPGVAPRARRHCTTTRLEAVPHASGTDEHVVDAVLASATGVADHAVAAAGRHRVLERVAREEITAGDVERNAR